MQDEDDDLATQGESCARQEVDGGDKVKDSWGDPVWGIHGFVSIDVSQWHHHFRELEGARFSHCKGENIDSVCHCVSLHASLYL